MSETLKKLRKKRGSAVKIDDDTFYVRVLTFGERRRVLTIPKEDSDGFVVGCYLCVDAEGTPACPINPGETDNDWAKRVTEALDDVPTDTIRHLSEAVGNLEKIPKVADIVKN